MFENSTQYSTVKLRHISFGIGSLIIVLWTVLRFLSQSLTFDLVGQQILAHQWLQGYHSGAMIGQTNYLLKILFIYIPFDAIGKYPFASLVSYTIGINVFTFCSIIVLLEKIWKLFHDKTPAIFFLLSVWFATLCASVFWIQFSNSRNLEVVGGLLVTYMLLRYYKMRQSRFLVVGSAVASLVFFADILQFYMVAIPLILFIVMNELLHKSKNWKSVLFVIVGLVSSFIMGKIVLSIVTKLLSLRIVAPSINRELTINAPITLIKQFMRLYMGGYEAGRIIMAANILLTVGIIVFAAYVFVQKKQRSMWSIMTLVLTILCVNGVVYIASGQSAVEGSFRYLIMTAPFIILLGTYGFSNLPTRNRRYIAYAFGIIMIASTVAVIVQTSAKVLRTTTPNAQQYAAIDVAQKYAFSFASMDTALPSMYLTHGRVQILPLECTAGHLQKTTLFFDSRYYDSHINMSQTITPLILDDKHISNKPYVCSIDVIERQFGVALTTTQLSNGSTVLLYPTQQILDKLQPIVP